MAARGESIHGYAELASLAFAPLREHVVAHIDNKQREVNDYLLAVDRNNIRLGWLSAVVISADLLLLLLCSIFLIGYQRRAERTALSQYDATHDALTGLADRVLLLTGSPTRLPRPSTAMFARSVLRTTSRAYACGYSRTPSRSTW